MGVQNETQKELPLKQQAVERTPTKVQKTTRRRKRANELDGRTWTRYSISIWSDIRKTPEELRLRHPAMFPAALVSRLIECFTNKDDNIILDPFAGIGSTAIAAEAHGKTGIAIEIEEKFAKKARERPITRNMFTGPKPDEPLGERHIFTDDARNLMNYVEPETVDLVITSPPYWDILLQQRTADYKEIRHYGDEPKDLGKIRKYPAFLNALKSVFELVFDALRPGKYCCVIVMDIRKKDAFYPFHADVANFMQDIGFIFDDIIIWDRRQEYSNLRPLGYPYVFRINKVHEYVLVFKKP